MQANNDDIGRRTIRRVVRRLVPFMFLCYVVAYIDRVNLGFVSKALKADLPLTDAQYGFGGGLFFIGYFLFEIPSNLALRRFGARVWIARIMIGWGLVSMATAFIGNASDFYAARLLLGVAEAGFFPGMVLYLTYWIPARERARAGALFMMAAPVAMVVGAPLSGLLLQLHGALGLKGWQWLFLIEGFPAIALGLLTLRWLTDRPAEAAWLPADERQWLEGELAADRARNAVSAERLHEPFKQPKVWLLCAIYFLNNIATYGIFLWLPQMLEDATGLKGVALGLVTALPFAAGIVGMWAIGRHSDRTGERKLHVAFCAGLAALGLLLAVASRGHPVPLVLAFTLCQFGQRSVMSVFWAIPPAFLGGAAAAAGIAFVNAVGNLGGYVGAERMGKLAKAMPDGATDHTQGLLLLTAALLGVAALSALLPIKKEPRP